MSRERPRLRGGRRKAKTTPPNIPRPRARHFIEHVHEWPDGRRHTCSYDWPLPAGLNPKSVLLRYRLFVLEGTWQSEHFNPGAIVGKAFSVQGVLLSRILTKLGRQPEILYGCDTPAHMLPLVQKHLDAKIRRELASHFARLKATGQHGIRESTLHRETDGTSVRDVTKNQQLLQDIPLGEFQEELFLIVQRRVNRIVRKRFAVLPEQEFDSGSRKWPGRCFAATGVFFDEALGEFRNLMPALPSDPPSIEWRGAELTHRILREILRRSRSPSLDQIYRDLHHRSVPEERYKEMACLLVDELLRAIPLLAELTSRAQGLHERLLDAVLQRSGVGFDGSRATHYRDPFYLARHLAAIATGSPADDDKTVKARQELFSRRMEYRDGRLRLVAHAARRLQ